MNNPRRGLRVTEKGLRAKYEAEVHDLRHLGEQMRLEGATPEHMARTLHARRRELAAAYKAMTPEPLRSRIEKRTVEVYDDPLGPSIEWLRTSGRSWQEIIDGAARPGRLPSGD